MLTSDKGVAMVIMDRQDCTNKGQGLLEAQGHLQVHFQRPHPKLKTQLIHILKIANDKDRSTKLHIKDFTLHKLSLPNFIGYQKSTN